MTTLKVMKQSSNPTLESVLDRARARGFLGPGPIRAHIDHARYFLDEINADAHLVLDLGSGGGIPGLPVAVGAPRLRLVLLDSSEKRCAFLREAVVELGLTDRVRVMAGRAEEVAHRPEVRGSVDVVVSRSFAAPHHTVECAMGLVRLGGRIIISEPPGGRDWPQDQLKRIGLSQLEANHRLACFRLDRPVDHSIPRRFKLQDREPLVTWD